MTSAAADSLVWTIDMALLVPLPCLRCGRIERCRCHVPLADRTKQRAEYIAARIREAEDAQDDAMERKVQTDG